MGPKNRTNKSFSLIPLHVEPDLLTRGLIVLLVTGIFSTGLFLSCSGGLFESGNNGGTPSPRSYDVTGTWTLTATPSQGTTCQVSSQAQSGVMTLYQDGMTVTGDYLQNSHHFPLTGSMSGDLFKAEIQDSNIEGLSGCLYDIQTQVQALVSDTGGPLAMVGDASQEGFGFSSQLHIHDIPECSAFSDCNVNGNLYASKQQGNAAPIAEAGPDQAVNTGTLVTLDGSSSHDPEGDPLTYSWTIISKPTGSMAALSYPTTPEHPTFTADKDGTYVIQLIVNDGYQDSASDTVTITASTLVTFVGGINKFTLNAQAITDTCYGGVFLPFVPTMTFQADVPGYAELPSVLTLPLPPPLPTVDLHLVWDPDAKDLKLDPNYDPIPVSLDVGEVFPLFPCEAAASATGVLTPTSDTTVNVLVEITGLHFLPTGSAPCILPNPRNPECVISVSLQGKSQ